MDYDGDRHVDATHVIASEAKQSILSLRGEMDCFVAYAPRNDDH
jgi:hypothetical protein